MIDIKMCDIVVFCCLVAAQNYMSTSDNTQNVVRMDEYYYVLRL